MNGVQRLRIPRQVAGRAVVAAGRPRERVLEQLGKGVRVGAGGLRGQLEGVAGPRGNAPQMREPLVPV